jgi:hypothetical protein
MAEQNQNSGPSVLAIGCGAVIVVMVMFLIMGVILVRAVISDVGHWSPFGPHWIPEPHHRPEPWDPDHDRHHHHRIRNERVEDFLDSYADNLATVYAEADRRQGKGDPVDRKWFDQMFLKAHDRAASGIKKDFEDKGEKPNYAHLSAEFRMAVEGEPQL